MSNTFEYVSIFQQELDKVFITSSVKFVDAMEDLKLVCNM